MVSSRVCNTSPGTRGNRLDFASAPRPRTEYSIGMNDSAARQTRSEANGNTPTPSPADRQWWTETVKMYLTPMYRFVQTRVPADAVNDLVQETFVSAAASVSRFDGRKASVWTWLLSISRKRIADYYRASGRDPLLNAATARLASDANDIEAALTSGNPLPDETCESEELRLVVRAALNSLEPRQQACLVARYYNDLSLDEVGRLMNVSPSAANSMLHRARAQLRQEIKRLLGGVANCEEHTR